MGMSATFGKLQDVILVIGVTIVMLLNKGIDLQLGKKKQ